VKKILLIIALISFFPVRGYSAFEFPPDVFRLMVEASAEPCSICAQQKLKKAYKGLNTVFAPGNAIDFDGACRLMKTGSGLDLKPACYPSGTLVRSLKEGEIPPEIVFEFYTDEKQLVGISGNELTKDKIAEQYRKAEPGTIFEGRIKLVPYKYGDGPAYNYFPKTNRLVFHCLVLDLRTIEP